MLAWIKTLLSDYPEVSQATRLMERYKKRHLSEWDCRWSVCKTFRQLFSGSVEFQQLTMEDLGPRMSNHLEDHFRSFGPPKQVAYCTLIDTSTAKVHFHATGLVIIN
jgi:hypothetical protein